MSGSRAFHHLFGVIALGVLALSSARAYAFNSDECAKELRSLDGQETMQPYTWTTARFESSSQFSSSSGGCAAFGAREKREAFLLADGAELRQQVAEGRGELIDALASLSGCPSTNGVGVALGGVLQLEYRALFPSGGNAPGSVAEARSIGNAVDRAIETEPMLRQRCGRLLGPS